MLGGPLCFFLAPEGAKRFSNNCLLGGPFCFLLAHGMRQPVHTIIVCYGSLFDFSWPLKARALFVFALALE